MPPAFFRARGGTGGEPLCPPWQSRAKFLLCRTHRCRAPGRSGGLAGGPVRERDPGRQALWARRGGHEGRDRGVRRGGRRGGKAGSISLLITGDEEGPAQNGTRKVLDWLKQKGERLDHCLVGEPTNPTRLGEMIKIGRRGSLNTVLTVRGTQGHVAYPQNADNPIPKLLAMLRALTESPLDQGTAHFQPSNLEITSVDVGNLATNVIPAKAVARFNIRFNDLHTGESLMALIKERLGRPCAAHPRFRLLGRGVSFTQPGPFTQLVAEAVKAETGLMPELSTTGGTSDARFIKDHCPVVEFGLAGKTMHKVDEHVPVADIPALARIYGRVLKAYFAA